MTWHKKIKKTWPPISDRRFSCIWWNFSRQEIFASSPLSRISRKYPARENFMFYSILHCFGVCVYFYQRLSEHFPPTASSAVLLQCIQGQNHTHLQNGQADLRQFLHPHYWSGLYRHFHCQDIAAFSEAQVKISRHVAWMTSQIIDFPRRWRTPWVDFLLLLKAFFSANSAIIPSFEQFQWFFINYRL